MFLWCNTLSQNILTTYYFSVVDFKPHLHVIVLTHDILSRVPDSLSLVILTTVLRFVVYVFKTTLAHFWCLKSESNILVTRTF